MHHRDTEKEEAAQREKICFFARAKKQLHPLCYLSPFVVHLCVYGLFFSYPQMSLPEARW